MIYLYRFHNDRLTVQEVEVEESERKYKIKEKIRWIPYVYQFEKEDVADVQADYYTGHYLFLTRKDDDMAIDILTDYYIRRSKGFHEQMERALHEVYEAKVKYGVLSKIKVEEETDYE